MRRRRVALALPDGGGRIEIDGTVISAAGQAIVAGSAAGGSATNKVTVGLTGIVPGNGTAGHGIHLFDGGNSVLNAGQIRAAGTNAAAIRLEDGGASVTNTGLISGGQTAISITGAVSSFTLELNLIKNTGTITCLGASAIRSTSALGLDTIWNTSLITGGIELFAGSDEVDNRGGIIRGQINLGAEDDRLFGGDGRESASGGSGADTLDFGGGNDTYSAGNSEGLPNDGDDELDGGLDTDTYDGSTIFRPASPSISQPAKPRAPKSGSTLS